MHAVSTRAIFVGLFAWLVLAIGRSSRIVSLFGPPWPQVLLVTLVVLLCAAYFFRPWFRAGINALPLSWLISYHAVRFVGWYFLWLYQQGRLPYAFAVPGGIGDIMVAAFAVVVAWKLPASWQLFWNVLGSVDILLVVVTAARLTLTEPASMIELRHLPLSLLITFIVPLIIFTHIVIFVRLARSRRGTGL